MIDKWGGATALYRLFSDEGDLVYVGISHHPEKRLKEHARDKAWWKEVKEARITWFARRTEAEMSEQDAITEEGPVRNRQLPPWRIGIDYEGQRAYLDVYRQLRREVIACIREGGDLDRVAQASGWSPVFIEKLVAQEEKRRAAKKT